MGRDAAGRVNCWYEDECLASIRGDEKYVYYYGDRPDELFNLSQDPLEKNNLADKRSKDSLEERRRDLLRWAARVEVTYEASDAR